MEVHKQCGPYHKSAHAQMNIISSLLPRLQALCDDIRCPPGDAVTLCDYGSADGGSSLPAVRAVIEKIRSRHSQSQMQIVYNDIIPEHFITLFNMFQGKSSKPTFLDDFGGVFVSACCRSFYSQCLPDDTVHCGFSFTSTQYLSPTSTCTLKEAVIYTSAHASPEEKMAVARQGADDLRAFLTHRARELAHGGRMMLTFQSFNPVLSNGILKMEELWRRFLREGIINENELEAISIPFVYRSKEDMEQGIEDTKAIFEELGVSVLDLFETLTPCPFSAMRKSKPEMKDGISKMQAKGTRQITGGFFTKGLLQRSEEDRNAILDKFYAELEQDIIENSDLYTVNTSYWVLCIGKA